jgi:hypothetical protein
VDSVVSQLLIVLVAIYVLDCFRWVSRNATVFRVFPFLKTQLSSQWQLGSQFKRGLVFGFPLPPFGSIFTSENWPAVIHKNGIRMLDFRSQLFAKPTADEIFISWSNAPALTLDERTLLYEKKPLHTFGSKRTAHAFVQLMTTLATEKGREKNFEKQLSVAFDVSAIEKRLKPWKTWRRVVYMANTLLFIGLFGSLYLLIQNKIQNVLMLGLCLLVLWILAVLSTVLALRRTLEKPFRPGGMELFVALVSPVALMRSNDLIEPELVSDFHSCAVAVALLPPQEARNEIERYLRCLEFPWAQAEAGADNQIEVGVLEDDVAFRSAMKGQLTRLVSLLPTTQKKTVNQLHCPRCLTEYQTGSSCGSCPAVQLVSAS